MLRKRAINAEIKKRNRGTLSGSDKVTTDEEKKELHELSFREFIISCFAYFELDHIRDENGKWGETGYKYGVDRLGEKHAREIFDEQVSFLNKHAQVKTCTHTDPDGCVYNSIVWK